MNEGYIYIILPGVPVTTAWRVPWVADGGVGLQIWRLAANIAFVESRPGVVLHFGGFGVRLRTSHCKNHFRSETSHRASGKKQEIHVIIQSKNTRLLDFSENFEKIIQST